MNRSGAVAFRAARAGGVPGIYVRSGAGTTRIAEAADGWSAFHGLPVVTDAGTVVFRADRVDGTAGIYAARDGAVTSVVETGDGLDALTLFPSATADGTVAFAATLEDGGAGAFVRPEGGACVTVARDGAYESYRNALIADGGSVILMATPRGGRLGLFAGPDPERDRILALGDVFHDSTVADLAANPVSVARGGAIAVRVALDDGRQLVARATLDPG
jgi:hypothetical protein